MHQQSHFEDNIGKLRAILTGVPHEQLRKAFLSSPSELLITFIGASELEQFAGYKEFLLPAEAELRLRSLKSIK